MSEQNYNNLTNLITELSSEIEKISFEKTNDSNTETIQSNSFILNPVCHNYNFVDNSWNTYTDNRNFSQNYNNSSVNDDSKIKKISSKKKDDRDIDEKSEEEDKKQNGNHPLVFIFVTGILSFGATYLIAKDDYRKSKTKFDKLSKIVAQIDDKTKNTKLESKCKELKDFYTEFRDNLLAKYCPSFYSKLGIIGSSLTALTYFYPFGLMALYPSLIGLFGFGCYWMWNSLTYDDMDKIVSSHKNLLNNLEEFKNEISKEYLNSVPINYQTHNWQVLREYSFDSQVPSAPAINYII